MRQLSVDWEQLSWSLVNADLIGTALALFALVGFGYGIGFWTSSVTQPDRSKLKAALKEKEKADRERDKARASLALLSGENRQYQSLRESLLGSETDLWSHHPPEPYEGYDNDIRLSGLHVLTIMNLKGGVGKTTLATNLAGYFSSKGRKRVLLVDLDFQGSATSAILNLTDFTDDLDVRIETLFKSDSGRCSPNDIIMPITHRHFNSRFGLAPCGYEFARVENQKLVAWIMRELPIDPRYMLAKFLYSESVRTRYDVVIVDAPPRLSMGAINALAASQALIIPTLPDKMSAEAVRNFIASVSSLRRALNPALQNAFVAINGTKDTNGLDGFENGAKVEIDEAIQSWGGFGKVLSTLIPRRAIFGNALANRSLAIFERDRNEPTTSEVLERFGAEVAHHLGID